MSNERISLAHWSTEHKANVVHLRSGASVTGDDNLITWNIRGVASARGLTIVESDAITQFKPKEKDSPTAVMSTDASFDLSDLVG